MLPNLKGYLINQTFCKIEKRMIIFLSLWVFVPVPLFLLEFSIVNNGFHSLSGFSKHYNSYGLELVLLTAMIFLRRRSNYYYLFIIPILISFFLSGSRSMLIISTLIIAFHFLYIFKHKIKYLLVTFSIFIFISIIGLSDRKYDGSNGERIEILNNFIEKIRGHAFLGYGGYTTVEKMHSEAAMPAHNFIIQITANYGFIVTFFYLLLLVTLFIKLEKSGKIIIFSLVLLGMTQPYFDFQPYYGIVMILFILSFTYSKMTRLEYDKI